MNAINELKFRDVEASVVQSEKRTDASADHKQNNNLSVLITEKLNSNCSFINIFCQFMITAPGPNCSKEGLDYGSSRYISILRILQFVLLTLIRYIYRILHGGAKIRAVKEIFYEQAG